MPKLPATLFRIAVVFVAALAATPVAVPERPAQAQGFFDRIFGPRPAAPERPSFFRDRRQMAPPPGEMRQPPARQRPRRVADPTPRIPVDPKDPTALKLVVVGDFLGASLAAGLDQAFAKEPRIAVVDRSEGSSGLVRTDFYDWTTELPKILNELKPDYVVIMLGANDRQQIRTGQERFQFRSPDWERVYRQRVAAIADTLKVYGRPAFWISAPPLRGNTASADMAYLNDIFQAGAESAGARFIDVWDGFADADGKFVTRGPDVDGRVLQLRSGDGINFTRAGQRKLAFYVDREIRRPGEGGSDTFLASTAPGDRIEILPDGSRQLVGPVIALGEPPPGASTELAGATRPAEPGRDSLQYRLIVRGETLPVVPGRVDDFRWPAAEAENPQAAAAQ